MDRPDTIISPAGSTFDERNGCVSLFEHDLFAQFPDASPNRVARVARAMDKLCYEANEGESDEYMSLCMWTRFHLKDMGGEYADVSYASLILSGEQTVDGYVDAVRQGGPTPPEDLPRRRYRGIYFHLLEGNPTLASRAKEYASLIERGCYNSAIESCLDLEEAPQLSWASQTFVSAYSYLCGNMAAHLDPTSAPVHAYGREVLDALAGGRLDPLAAGAVPETELCPKATKTEKEEIELRSAVRVKVKTSALYRCPHCGARKCSYQTAQRRALDEEANIECLCEECGQRFEGRS